MTETELERLARTAIAAEGGEFHAWAWLAYDQATRPEAVLALISRIRELEEGLRPFARLTVDGKLPAQFSEKYPLFAESVDRARALLPESTS